MTRARPLLASTLLLACTPHEHPREPQAPCPPGMALVEGGPGGPLNLCVDLTEVTTAAYGACVHAGACTPAVLDPPDACNLTHPDRGAHPINCVTLDQAQAHCAWLGKRLPTDDEWWWAARPLPRREGDTTVTTPGRVGGFPWGSEPADPTRACPGPDATCPSGQYPAGASPDGLLDLAGNVAEWTLTGERARLRGGNWRDLLAPEFAPGARLLDAPADPSPVSGFRCVVAPHTPVDSPDLDLWTPHRPGPVERPVLAAPVAIDPPVRPLANLAVLHHSPFQRAPGRWWPLGDGFLAGDTADAFPFAQGDPIDRLALPETLREFAPVRDLGDTLLMKAGWSNNLRFIAVEPGAHTIRWQLALAKYGATYEHFLAPQTLVAEFYGDAADTVIGFSLAGGHELWRLRGGPDQPFTRVAHLWTDGARGYIRGDRGLSAFDFDSGALLWSGLPVGDGCGVVTGDGALVIETADGQGHLRLDPLTGVELGRIAAATRTCTWGKSPYDGGVAPAVLEAGQLLAFDPPDARGSARLRAHDRDTGALRWTRPGFAHDFLVADHDAVYVTRNGETLIALDIATGEPRVEISIGTDFGLDLRPGGGEAGPLVVVTAHGVGTTILGRGEQPVVPEPYRIRGRLVPDGVARRRVAGVRVRVGPRRVRTDAAGRFDVRGAAVGTVAVALGTDLGPDQPGGSRVRFEPLPVTLDGRGTYDVGDVNLYPWYIE